MIKKRFVCIDIIRGLASISILTTHLYTVMLKFLCPSGGKLFKAVHFPIHFIWVGGGIHPGVIVFIVLSGFCIHFPLAKDKTILKSQNFWAVYARRRMLRILPVFWVSLLISHSINFLLNNGNAFNHSSLLALFISSTALGEIGRIFFDDLRPYLYAGNTALGTVAVEILLYIAYPFYLLIYKKKSLLSLMSLVIGLYLLIHLVRIVVGNADFLLGTVFEFSLYFVWGGICAELFMRTISTDHSPLPWGRYSMATFVFYLILIYCVPVKGLHIFTTVLFGITIGMVIIFLMNLEHRHNATFGPLAIFAKIGKRSYSLYAIHMPTIAMSIIFCEHFHVNNAYYFPVTIIFIVIVTGICYRFIELPSHNFAKKL